MKVNPAWYTAITTGNLEQLKQSLPISDINQKYPTEKKTRYITPLILACRFYNKGENRLPIVEWLIDNGADVNLRDSMEYTPLHEACDPCENFISRPALIQLLLSRPEIVIDPTVYSADEGTRNTPLNWILSRSSTLSWTELKNWVTCVTILICKGARIDLVETQVPEWVNDLVLCRKNCKKAALLMVGIRRFQRSEVMRVNGKDVACLIAKHVLSTQIHPAWKHRGDQHPKPKE